MQLQAQLAELKKLLDGAQEVMVFLPEEPNYDQIAGGLGLYLGLLKHGKLVHIAGTNYETQKFSDLVAVDKVKNSLGGKNMVISLPYTEGEIEKVSYNFDGNKFNLVIEPKGKALPFSQEEVTFSAGGVNAELVFTIGVQSIAKIGSLYHENRALFERVAVVNIDNAQENEQFGRVNIINPSLPTVSEIVTLVLKNIGVTLDKDIATNIYRGLHQGTNNFHPDVVSALTLEAAALCLRSGVQRAQTSPPPKKPIFSPSHKQSPSVRAPFEPSRTVARDGVTQSVAAPAAPSDLSSVPSDWLKPKLFTSTKPQ